MTESRPPCTTAWHFCASCAVTLLCWTVWLLLAFVLAWQGYIALVKDVSVPDFILRRVEASLAAENFSVRFGRAHFDPRGGILLENVQLRSGSFEEPLLTSQYIYLRKSIWSYLSGQRLPDVVWMEGASVQLPAMLSPSGTAEQLLRDVNAEFRFSSKIWTVERLTGRMANLPISITGDTARLRSSGGTPLSGSEITSRYLKFARQIVQALPELQSIERPIMAISCTPRENGGTNLMLQFSADAIRRPGGKPVELGPVSILGQWAWDGLNTAPLELQLETTQAVVGELRAENVRTWLTFVPGTGSALLKQVNGRLAATSLQVLGETWDAPQLVGFYEPGTDEVQLTATFQSYGQVMSIGGSADLKHKSAFARFVGAVEPALVTSMLTRYGPKLEPYFRFGDPVMLNATLKLNENWKFGGVWSRAQTGRLDSHGVQVTSARGRVDVDGDLNFLAHDAYVVAGENEARGMYWMNFKSMDFRYYLTGRLRPPDISGWITGQWWTDFWKNFGFPVAPPQADVDVQGCYKPGQGGRMTYYGSADANSTEVLGADFARAHVRLFIRPQFTHAMDVRAERADGTQRATGWFKRKSDPGNPTVSELNFDLTGNLDVPSLQKLGGETAVNLLAPFEFTRPPQLHLWGRTAKTDGQSTSDLQFTGEMAAPFKYHQFPLERAAVNGNLHGPQLQLEQFNLRVAGGEGSGGATLDGPVQNRLLKLDFKIKNADLARSIRAVESFEVERTGVKSESMTESKFIKRASGGKLELALTAQGNPDNPTRLHGTGTMQLTGAELAEINLFGLLSQLLSFSSLKLDAARSSFQMADGRLYFPDVRVTGKSALIDAKGSFSIDSKLLDFTARLKPYEETHNPLTAMVGLFMNPLTSMFELQLNGPLSNPKWTVALGTSNPKPVEPEKPVTSPVVPEAPSPAVGGPASTVSPKTD